MDRKLLSKEAIDDLEYRIQQEEFSSRLYKDMSLWFEDKGYLNLAKVYDEYSEEEMEHSTWASDFMLSYGIKPRLRALPSPEVGYNNCLEILNATLSHEIDVQNQCEKLSKNALQRGEIALYTLGLKYVTEQIDEAKKSFDFLSIYKATKDELLFDEYIGKHYL